MCPDRGCKLLCNFVQDFELSSKPQKSLQYRDKFKNSCIQKACAQIHSQKRALKTARAQKCMLKDRVLKSLKTACAQNSVRSKQRAIKTACA